MQVQQVHKWKKYRIYTTADITLICQRDKTHCAKFPNNRFLFWKNFDAIILKINIEKVRKKNSETLRVKN